MDALPEELAELYRGLEDTLLEEICSRLNIASELNEVTVADIKALRSHGIPLEEIKKAIAEVNKISMEKLDKLFDDVVERNQAYYFELITLADVTRPDTLVDAVAIEAIRRQTKGELRNITQSMGFTTKKGGKTVLLPPGKMYQTMLDRAVMEVESGAISYNEAISRAVKELAGGGLKTVNYDSGIHRQIDSQVRTCVMAGINQINQKYREQSMEYLETDLVETTAHLGARNTGSGYFNHESWQGKIFRWSEKSRASKGHYPDLVEDAGYGYGGGIGGWNCRHSFYPYIEGVMEPIYSKKELDSMKAENHKITFEGEEYDGYQATQMQRRIEQQIRKDTRLRDAYKAAGLTEDAQTANIKLRRLNEKYSQFSKAAGLPEKRERTRVLYADDASKAKAAKASERLEKYSQIRYHKDGRIVVTDDWTWKKHATIPREYEPNAVVDTLSRGGKQKDRTIYGPDAIIQQQIHGGDHGQSKQHPFGKYGEHVHDYTWFPNGGKPDKPARDPTKEDRIKHKDILGDDDDDG